MNKIPGSVIKDGRSSTTANNLQGTSIDGIGNASLPRGQSEGSSGSTRSRLLKTQGLQSTQGKLWNLQ